MPDPRYCCVLGICCPPGGAEQRADMRAWLLSKIDEVIAMHERGGNYEKLVDSWLDELPWKPAGE